MSARSSRSFTVASSCFLSSSSRSISSCHCIHLPIRKFQLLPKRLNWLKNMPCDGSRWGFSCAWACWHFCACGRWWLLLSGACGAMHRRWRTTRGLHLLPLTSVASSGGE
ncbi:hypothetical protein L917_18870 [Phytophthora nicotianae]|uniref:Uncharacterized protein n=1 Tax=Phytophthora nicotianae TaxID=4792 RepID=W2K804_PHYNI|nr:hypothetical protein L917_18870 [Phytophthora nicotianae]